MPDELGPWRKRSGSEQKLDPRIARIAGCTDHVVRTYTNDATGVQVTVMVLYGNAETVAGHTPEVCYPSAGFRLVDGPEPRAVRLADGCNASFRSLVFARALDDAGPRNEVLYSFRHEGQWFADVENHRRLFRHRPSLYKIQTQRSIAPNEHRNIDNPSEELVALLVNAIEGKLGRVR